MSRNKNIAHILMLVLTSVMLSGCYGHKVIGLLQDPKDNKQLPVYEKDSTIQPYRIHVNDELVYRLITQDANLGKILNQGNGSNYGSSQYANSYIVYKDGTIDLPYMKPIYVEGLTVEEAQDTIEARFKELIPDASVKVALYNKTFTVIGDIHSGEYYIYKEKLNIFEALAMTGDLMNSGDRRHVRIIRPNGDAEPEVLEFDIRTNTIIDSKYYYIQPNDVIYVARTKSSFVRVESYAGVLGLVTSSVSLLVSVVNYAITIADRVKTTNSNH